jgi:hypothetical protein
MPGVIASKHPLVEVGPTVAKMVLVAEAAGAAGAVLRVRPV